MESFNWTSESDIFSDSRPSFKLTMLSVMSADNDGRSNLHLAVLANNKHWAKILIDGGARLNLMDHKGGHPLYYAIDNDNKTLVEMLLKAGADINIEILAEKDFSLTPLQVAIKRNNKEMVEIILNYKPEIDKQDREGKTAVTHAIWSDLSILELLISHGANVNIFDNVGHRPLYYAIKKKKLPVVRILLDGGADIHQCHSSAVSNTPLKLAFSLGLDDLVEDLMKRGAKTFTQENQLQPNTSALYAAMERSRIRYDVLKMMLTMTPPDELEAAFHCKDFYLLQHAAQYLESRVVQLIAKHANVQSVWKSANILKYAIQNRDRDVFEFFFKSGIARVNEPDSEGYMAIHRAIMLRVDNQRLTYLIDKGADVNAAAESTDELTPLHLAVIHGREETVEVLLDHGAEIFMKNRSNESVYRYFCNRSSVDFQQSTPSVMRKNIKLILKRIAILEASDQPVSLEDLRHIVNENTAFVKRYYLSCQLELKMMKQIRVDDSVTLFDLLTSKDLKYYVHDETFIRKFSLHCVDRTLRNRFVNYFDALEARFFDELNKVIMKKRRCKYLGHIMGMHENAFYPVIERVLSNLRTEDLNNLEMALTNKVLTQVKADDYIN